MNNFIITKPMAFTMVSQASAIKLEMAGLKHSQGSVYAFIKKSYGWKGTRKAIHERLLKVCRETKKIMENGYRVFYHEGEVYPVRVIIMEPDNEQGYVIPKSLYQSMVKEEQSRQVFGAVILLNDDMFDKHVTVLDEHLKSTTMDITEHYR